MAPAVARADRGAMQIRTRVLSRIVPIALAIAVVVAAYCTNAQAATTARTVALPSATQAQQIVAGLWKHREAALTSLDTHALGPIEGGVAIQLDVSYINGVRCSCIDAKDPHPLVSVRPLIPASSVQPSFMAAVRTTNKNTGTHPWYLVAVARQAGTWKLAFVTYATENAALPLPELSDSASTPAIDAIAHARMTRMAVWQAHATSGLYPKPIVNEYGATVRTRAKVRTTLDGVYGLVLPSGEYLSCFTLHLVATTSMKGGVQQDAGQEEWGKALAPGTYRNVTVDSAVPECMVGTGTGAVPGMLRLQYDTRVVSATGVPR
jgi:hypothetical protein